MDLTAFKIISMIVMFFVALIGGFLPMKVSSISKVAMHTAYAFAGGILAAVAMVHMLADASDDLEDTGKDFAMWLGQPEDDADFPMGNTIFLLGFFCISFVEVTLHHTLGGAHHAHNRSHGSEGLLEDQANTANAAGWATVVGLTIHSFFEAMAAGAGTDETQVGFVIFAIAVHKGFAAFAYASVNLPLLRQGKKTLWIGLVLWFVVTFPLGMGLGMALVSAVEGAGLAAVTAFAAGTLLSVAITEMILPAFEDGKGLGLKLFMATISMLAMSLLAVWA